MKVTLELDKLLEDGKITQEEYVRISELAALSTGSLPFNILIGFGVLAVSGAALALMPSHITAIVLGLIILAGGLSILLTISDQWKVLANICILVGSLMAGGGIVVLAEGSLLSIFVVTAILSTAGIFARSSLLIVLATLMLSASIGARSGDFHANYFLGIQEPFLTIVLFSILAIGLLQLSKKLKAEFEIIALTGARTSVFLVNFGFWIGSLWGDRNAESEVIIVDWAFSILWAIALIITAIWAWRANRRWVLNTVATFGAIHFYTQWFETLGASPRTVLVAGVIALALALGLRSLNARIKENA